MFVRLRGLRWALDDPQAGVGEDRVKGVGELAATVADQELQLRHIRAGVDIHEEVTSGLDRPRPAAARGGLTPGSLKDVPDGRSRDRVAKAGQFTVDAPVAPAMRKMRALTAAEVGGRPRRRRLL
ncbi:hypothetical protein ACWDRB_54635 [Nonomuraea sp. NPDC003707]